MKKKKPFDKKEYAKNYYQRNKESILEYQKQKYTEKKIQENKHYKPKIKPFFKIEKKSIVITFD